MNREKEKVWLITGVSSGLGRAFVERTLAAGYRVCGTARKPDALRPFVEQYPDDFFPLELEVTDFASIKPKVDSVVEHFGRLDVVVNNAGYGLEGAIEELELDQIRRQMDVNFFGLVEVCRAALPWLRQNKGSTIFNISSIAGLRGSPAMGAYNASKFAVVGLSEAMSLELKDLGVRVCIVEPGPYKTDWAGRSLHHSKAIQNRDPNSPYRAINELIVSMIDGQSGKQPGDPYQIADVLISAAEHPAPPLHMIFGDEAIKMWETKYAKLASAAHVGLFPHSRRKI
jgi:NAD(P)-dependent dehydrogenase (short-subunit alcohol dehydrogenase family)